ncbi:anaerobic C4-dicarboxylate transporter family protein [Vibrio salinus]|uniref:anaerobic C4-dicarboxylate transporter family protein n=1 Tax=Vibrio salinus TaxID=2899784 RepID=UPI002150AC60|nr:anaerobic C4-dicarboxylate transporter family protein [Vibrio salinus]
MLFVQVLLLLGCIILAAKLGGVGVGLAGGLGMVVAVYILGLAPGNIPVSVILIIMSVY